MLRIGYDAQAFLSPNGGMGKGLQLRNLLGSHIDTFIGFTSKSPNNTSRTFIQEGFSGHSAWQEFSLPRILSRHKIDIFLSPENTAPFLLPSSVRLILVLHDMILFEGFRQQKLKHRMKESFQRLQIPRSVARAEVVLTVSDFSRNEILRAFPQANVRVIPCTIPEIWFQAVPAVARENFFLLVTSSAPHKNAAGAFEGYAQYVRAVERPVGLRVVGLSDRKKHFEEKLRVHGILDKVAFLPFLTDKELRETYQKSQAVIVPSFSEGFGIPVLEAMATGTPVLCSNATSLPEVGGEAPVYFDPRDTNTIASAIERTASDVGLRAYIAQKGIERAMIFHPTRVAEMVDAFWREMRVE